METYTELKDLVENPLYQVQRQKTLCGLTNDMIDAPIIEIINGFNKMPYCFTLQSCYGHFMHADQQDRNSTEPLPISDNIAVITYRIAYVALCIENSPEGQELFEGLRDITAVDPEYVQFGSPEWFWARHVNSYALQVEPKRYMDKDQIAIDYREALHIQEVRNGFFSELRKILDKQQKSI